MNGMMYVGKKLAKFKTTKKPLKGKKNKRRGTKESDWKTYWGSSEKLTADIEKHRRRYNLLDRYYIIVLVEV